MHPFKTELQSSKISAFFFYMAIWIAGKKNIPISCSPNVSIYFRLDEMTDIAIAACIVKMALISITICINMCGYMLVLWSSTWDYKAMSLTLSAPTWADSYPMSRWLSNEQDLTVHVTHVQRLSAGKKSLLLEDGETHDWGRKKKTNLNKTKKNTIIWQ